ncbi:DNA polymerase IV [Candidatus Bathyarchaeota archaeon CG07_land_8_20_14_0_80_47_9]|nr:MAG: DNA polymerase IV [Candidatus Bathyarchaeota archaeon CG07_land_8_20_14_0_80_47_9]
MQPRVIMLVDFDYFFAQIEERRNPSIEGKPVVVCVYSGRSQDSGAVSTANYVARRYGIKSGMPIALAKSKLENVEAVFLPVDHRLYEEVSEKTMTVLRGYADYFEQVGIDEAYLDVSRRVNGSFEQAAELARRAKNDIRAQCELTCSIGISPNKLVAKIAADAQKPDGLTIVKPDQVESFLAPLPVDHLIGVGVKTKERMETMGIRTIGDLAKYDVRRLIEVFGRKLGTYFHNASMGIDDEPVQERGEAESMSRIATLKEDTRDLKVILDRTDRLCEEVHEDVRQRGLGFKSVGIIAVFIDMSIRSKSKTLDNPADELEILKRTVWELFEKLLSDSELNVRRAGVRVSNFAKEQKTQKQITSFLGNFEG